MSHKERNSTNELWHAVDDYIIEKLIPEDPILEATMKTTEDAGLPNISVSPTHGRLLNLLVRFKGAKRILEIGTLGGYSAIWLARGLPDDGKLVSLEYNPVCLETATKNLQLAGLKEKVEIKLGKGVDSLDEMIESKDQEPFDIVFIDANKDDGAAYFEKSLALTRSGSMIIVDNAVRRGNLLQGDNPDPQIQGTRALYDALSNSDKVDSTCIQTIGSRSHDGLLFAYVK
ncbi:O-methyltransferase [Backusella circina FSU 941]|nr:O-methyltransferase [Backusella circina FSU 941]